MRPADTTGELDSRNIWHPFTQMKTCGPLPVITRASGAVLFGEDGREYIDAISSWWVNLHGHCHPHITSAIARQANTLDQIIFAGFTHPPAAALSERLLSVLPSSHSRIFFSDNGSTAVEVAVKMALQFWHNRGEQRNRIVALENGYHGDTFGAMSASARGAFTAPFQKLLFGVSHFDPADGKGEPDFESFEALVSGGEVAAFIYEPLVQGASGMRIYAKETLQQLLEICERYEVLTIADEVMTGFGRTGRMFASEYAGIQPDIVCLSKGITGGALALGVTSCTTEIYDAFLDDDRLRMFFHGHSYTANPIACAAAIASLDLLSDPACLESIQRISRAHARFAESVRARRGVENARALGTIFALDIVSPDQPGDTDLPGSKGRYFHGIRDTLYKFFIDRGLLLRPLGNVVYIMPPYCISDEQLGVIYETIEEALSEVIR